MGRKLYYINNFQFNFGGHIHYLATNIATYLQAVGASAYIDFPNYRIVNNLVLLSAKQEISEGVFSNIYTRVKYFIDHDEDAGEMYCYRVVSKEERSGFYAFGVEADLWANALPQLQSIKNVIAKRCNRRIDTFGVYDEIATTQGAKTATRFTSSDLTLSDVSVVYELSYNVSQGLFGGSPITKTSLFSRTLQEIYDHVHLYAPEYDAVEIIEKTIDVIGGIFQMTDNNIEVSAKVVRAWLIPTEAIAFSNFQAPLVVSKNLLTGERSFAASYALKPQIFVKSFNLSQMSNFSSFVPDYKIEFGGMFNGLELQRFVNNWEVNIRFVFSNSEISVIAQQGDRQYDITRSFALELTTNNESENALSSAAKAVTKIGGGIGAIASSYAVGNVGGALAAGGMYAATLARGSADAATIPPIGGGDASLSYYAGSSTAVKSPYFLMTTKSAVSEAYNAYFKGASFHFDWSAYEGYTALGLIHSAAHLGNVAESAEKDGTFLQADILAVEGVTKEQEEFIIKEFARGIWYKPL